MAPLSFYSMLSPEDPGLVRSSGKMLSVFSLFVAGAEYSEPLCASVSAVEGTNEFAREIDSS